MNILLTSKNINLIKKTLRQVLYFSTRLPYANTKIREIWIDMDNTTYNTTENMIDKSRELKGKKKLKFYKNLSNNYDERKIRNFRFEQDPFARNAEGIGKIY